MPTYIVTIREVVEKEYLVTAPDEVDAVTIVEDTNPVPSATRTFDELDVYMASKVEETWTHAVRHTDI